MFQEKLSAILPAPVLSMVLSVIHFMKLFFFTYPREKKPQPILKINNLDLSASPLEWFIVH